MWAVTDEELKTNKAFSLSDSHHISDYTISHCWSSPPTAHPFIRSADKHPVVMAMGVRKVYTKSFIWTAGINILSSIPVTYSSGRVHLPSKTSTHTLNHSKTTQNSLCPSASLLLFILTSLCPSLTHTHTHYPSMPPQQTQGQTLYLGWTG